MYFVKKFEIFSIPICFFSENFFYLAEVVEVPVEYNFRKTFFGGQDIPLVFINIGRGLGGGQGIGYYCIY